eukprot:Gb_15275 [translate_table: standard]
MWYSSITPDQEFPEQIRLLINDILGEISQRVRRINLIDLLTRDMVDLIGSHLELYRRNQAYIGVDVMDILSSEERDERLKHYLADAKELHPALLSSEAECKVLQRLMGGVVAIVLRPKVAQCPIVRCLARELLACVVMQPIMNFASPVFINELIEYLVLSSREEVPNKKAEKDESANVSNGKSTHGAPDRSVLKDRPAFGLESVELVSKSSTKDKSVAESDNYGRRGLSSSHHDEHPDHQMKHVRDPQSRPGDWAQLVEATRQGRTHVLTPENLDNLWTKGRNYRQKESSKGQAIPSPLIKSSVPQQDTEGTLKQDVVLKTDESFEWRNTGKSTATNMFDTAGDAKRNTDKIKYGGNFDLMRSSGRRECQDRDYSKQVLQIRNRSVLEGHCGKQEESGSHETRTSKIHHRRSKSGGTAFEGSNKLDGSSFPEDRGSWGPKKLQGSKVDEGQNHFYGDKPSAALWPQTGYVPVPKLECWVLGVHFEKVGLNSFAVYSIAVTNSENKTWFVDRRYRNFEQLHRHLRDIPNYTLHLPPKRFISSSLDDFFIRQRCILLDKYLKDLLSIPNIAEQHEVWDFLSATSKNYSFGKTPSVMKTLAFNVDDAMVDIFRQFKGVSSGLRHRGTSDEMSSSRKSDYANLSWTSETAITSDANWDNINRSRYLSDDEEAIGEVGYEDTHFLARTDGWQSDSELHVEHFSAQPNMNPAGNSLSSILSKKQQSEKILEALGSDGFSTAGSLTGSDIMEDEVGFPPEWNPPKLSVPLLNLVDKIFHLQRRGWLRRQVFWIAKQILHLVMEDAIDDWLLRQIQWLRREDVIASGIKQVEDVLWPDGIFILKNDIKHQTENARSCSSGEEATAKAMDQTKITPPPSFELQLEAARRASVVREIILEGAPAPLVSLIGGKQYHRCAKDIYFFLQSTVCVKQLAYSILELLLITTFPELHDLVCDIRGCAKC